MSDNSLAEGGWLKVVAAGELADTGLAHRFELAVAGKKQTRFCVQTPGRNLRLFK